MARCIVWLSCQPSAFNSCHVSASRIYYLLPSTRSWYWVVNPPLPTLPAARLCEQLQDGNAQCTLLSVHHKSCALLVNVKAYADDLWIPCPDSWRTFLITEKRHLLPLVSGLQQHTHGFSLQVHLAYTINLGYAFNRRPPGVFDRTRPAGGGAGSPPPPA